MQAANDRGKFHKTTASYSPTCIPEHTNSTASTFYNISSHVNYQQCINNQQYMFHVPQFQTMQRFYLVFFYNSVSPLLNLICLYSLESRSRDICSKNGKKLGSCQPVQGFNFLASLFALLSELSLVSNFRRQLYGPVEFVPFSQRKRIALNSQRERRQPNPLQQYDNAAKRYSVNMAYSSLVMKYLCYMHRTSF